MEGRTICLFKLQSDALSVVMCVITLHYISVQPPQMKEKSRLSLTCWVLARFFCQRLKKYLGAYYMDDLEKLTKIDIGSLDRFIRNSKWFRD